MKKPGPELEKMKANTLKKEDKGKSVLSLLPRFPEDRATASKSKGNLIMVSNYQLKEGIDGWMGGESLIVSC